MKKLLSVLLILTMLMTVVLIVPITSNATGPDATKTTYTLYDNVSTNILKYTGGFSYKTVKTSGRGTNLSYAIDDTSEVTVKTGTTSDNICFDGSVTEAEWGKPTLDIDSDYAATFGSKTPSKENTFYYYNLAATKKLSEAAKESGQHFKIWLRWDTDYFYIAAIVDDADTFNNANSTATDIWAGDSLQTRIDPQGPNSILDGGYYTGRNYTTISTGCPWKGSVRTYDATNKLWGTETYSTTGNYGFAFNKTSKSSVGVDYAFRYNKTAAVDSDGNLLKDSDGNQVYKYTGNELDGTNGTYKSYQTVLPVKTVSGSTTTYQEVYECAIPWASINSDVSCQVQAGTVLGMSIAVLNGTNGLTGDTNQWTTWGSGICNSQLLSDPITCGGSNAAVLSNTLWNDSTVCTHDTFTAPDCTHGYVCTQCGYEKGFPLGHIYSVSDVVLPTATTDGSALLQCTRNNDDTRTVSLASSDVRTISSWPSNSTPLYDTISKTMFSSWADSKIRDPNTYTFNSTTGQFDSSSGSPVVDASGNPRWMYTTFNGDSVVDCTYRTIKIDNVVTQNDDGTYTNNPVTKTGQYQSQYEYYCTSSDNGQISGSFGYSTDIYFTTEKLDSNNQPIYGTTDEAFYYNTDRTNGYYVYFGGGTGSTSVGMGYIAGFMNKPGTNVGRFVIATEKGKSYNSDNGDTIAINDANGIMDSSTIIAESDEFTMTENTWHNFMFLFDNDKNIAALAIDGVVKAAAYDVNFTYSNYSNITNHDLITWSTGCAYYLKNPTIGTLSSFKLNAATPTYKVTLADGTGAGTYSAGDTVSISATVPSGRTFYSWNTVSGVTYTDAKASSTTFVMPAADVTLGFSSYLLGDINDDGFVNAKDLLMLRKEIAGLLTLTDIQSAAANMDKSTAIDAVDVLTMKKYIVGVI